MQEFMQKDFQFMHEYMQKSCLFMHEFMQKEFQFMHKYMQKSCQFMHEFMQKCFQFMHDFMQKSCQPQWKTGFELRMICAVAGEKRKPNRQPSGLIPIRRKPSRQVETNVLKWEITKCQIPENPDVQTSRLLLFRSLRWTGRNLACAEK